MGMSTFILRFIQLKKPSSIYPRYYDSKQLLWPCCQVVCTFVKFINQDQSKFDKFIRYFIISFWREVVNMK